MSLLASYGALRWTGSVLAGTTIGTLCGLAAAFTANAVGVAVRRDRGGAANEHLARGEHGVLVGTRGSEIVATPLFEVVMNEKAFPLELVELAGVLVK